ncbi:phospholipase D family protein [Thalassococcus sp. BH17M4-6]|uniref:phospholipase D family protein n=1 Tax=Thalassococcus sp. BH17M4-6 TaxID=3413148 RepID=UPI003BBE8657
MTLTPLITAAEGFPALERLAMSAQDELFLSFRIFDPRTRLRDPQVRERGLDTWADLLALVAQRGVKLRMAVADFDPVLASHLHRQAWTNASGFADTVQGDVQILCAPHGQNAGTFWRLVIWGKLNRRLRALRSDDPNRLTPVQRQVLKSGPILRPVTLHQKCAVADGTRCIIGGLDVNERRYDDHDHEGLPEETWHDVAAEIHGDFAASLRAHLADTWNAALACGAASLADRALPIDTSARTQSPVDMRLVRTFSDPCNGVARLSPAVRITEHEAVLLKEIGKAERHIYIETQFLRHAPIADALVSAARRADNLQLVIVLPPEPDRVMFDGDTNWDARHAQGLQLSQLEKLRDAFGDRLALIAPAQPFKAPEGSAEVYGAGPVYVHSKVTLIDDRFGLIGSANLNGRSMRWDTEASVAFRDPATIRGLHDRLARIWLADHRGDKDITQAEVWNAAAKSNVAVEPDQRIGFALPFPMQRAREFSRRLPLVPPEFF